MIKFFVFTLLLVGAFSLPVEKEVSVKMSTLEKEELTLSDVSLANEIDSTNEELEVVGQLDNTETSTVEYAEERQDHLESTVAPEERYVEEESSTQVTDERTDTFETTNEPEYLKQRSDLDAEETTPDIEELAEETTLMPNERQDESTSSILEERIDLVETIETGDVEENDELEITTQIADERVDNFETTESANVDLIEETRSEDAESSITPSLEEESVNENIATVETNYLRSGLQEIELIESSTANIKQLDAETESTKAIESNIEPVSNIVNEIETDSAIVKSTDEQQVDTEEQEVTTEINVTYEESEVRKSSSANENVATIELVEVDEYATAKDENTSFNEGAEITVVEITESPQDQDADSNADSTLPDTPSIIKQSESIAEDNQITETTSEQVIQSENEQSSAAEIKDNVQTEENVDNKQDASAAVNPDESSPDQTKDTEATANEVNDKRNTENESVVDQTPTEVEEAIDVADAAVNEAAKTKDGNEKIAAEKGDQTENEESVINVDEIKDIVSQDIKKTSEPEEISSAVDVKVDKKLSEVAQKYGLTKIENTEVEDQKVDVKETLDVSESNSVHRRLSFGSKLSQFL